MKRILSSLMCVAFAATAGCKAADQGDGPVGEGGSDPQVAAILAAAPAATSFSLVAVRTLQANPAVNQCLKNLGKCQGLITSVVGSGLVIVRHLTNQKVDGAIFTAANTQAISDYQSKSAVVPQEIKDAQLGAIRSRLESILRGNKSNQEPACYSTEVASEPLGPVKPEHQRAIRGQTFKVFAPSMQQSVSLALGFCKRGSVLESTAHREKTVVCVVKKTEASVFHDLCNSFAHYYSPDSFSYPIQRVL